MKKKKRKFDFVVEMETAADTTWKEASLLLKNRLSTSLNIKEVKIERPMGFWKQIGMIFMGFCISLLLLIFVVTLFP